MKLVLKNFRCYLNRTFDFGDEGLVLLSGSSGIGKSSILIAINFVLYGIGNKVVMNGKTSCKVEMIININNRTYNIVRTKRPNRVVLTIIGNNNEEIFEDSTAQNIINKVFGDNFETTAYISQNAKNSFVMMSPLEKLEFLETFAFKDVDLINIKSKTKTLIKDNKEQHISILSKLEMANNVFSEMTKPEVVNFPIKCSNNKKEFFIKNEEIKLKNSNILIKKNTKIIKKLNIELNELKILKTFIDNKLENILKIENKIKTLNEEKLNYSYEGDIVFSSYKDRLENIINRREAQVLKENYDKELLRFEDLKIEEETRDKEELNDIENKLWNEHSITLTDEIIEDLQQIIEDTNEISRIKKRIKKVGMTTIEIKAKITELEQMMENSKEELETKKELYNKFEIEKEIYDCPSCGTHLKFINNNLHISENKNISIDITELEYEIKILEKNINKTEFNIHSYNVKLERIIELNTQIENINNKYEEMRNIDELNEDLTYMIEYKNKNINLENMKMNLTNKIKNGIYSNVLVSLKNSIEKNKKNLEKLNYNDTTEDELSEKELMYIIENQKESKYNLLRIQNRVDELTEEKKYTNNEINMANKRHIEQFSKVRNIENIERMIEKKEIELENLEDKKVVHTENLNKIEHYKRYIFDLEKYNEWKNKTEEISIEEKDVRMKYSAVNLFKEKILEAESVSILNVVNSINTHVQLFLDKFFVENPMSANLLTFKNVNKNNKPQINIGIDYKGIECDISMLSGGELSRLILSFTLALSDMFNSPIIMLDECTSSLDQELTTIVINTIKEFFPNKLVIIVAHQALDSSYDRTIRLS